MSALAELLQHGAELVRSLVAQILILLIGQDTKDLLPLVMNLLGALSLVSLLQLDTDDVPDDFDFGLQNLILRGAGLQQALFLYRLFLGLEVLKDAVQLLNGQIPKVLDRNGPLEGSS